MFLNAVNSSAARISNIKRNEIYNGIEIFNAFSSHCAQRKKVFMCGRWEFILHGFYINMTLF